MKIAVFGMGYVGLTGAGCLLKEGHHVLGVEPNEDKIATILSGKSPIFEPGLDDLLAEGLADGRLGVSTTSQGKLEDVDIALVCVGTPSAPDGSHNMSYIAEVSRQIAMYVSHDRTTPLTVVYRSTIRPGSIDMLIEPIFRSVLGKRTEALVELVYNPEFLRESVAVKDYFNPPKIVIGTKDGKPSLRMEELNKNISAPTFYCGYREAEFTKFVDNTWHAVKVAFANEIGRVCVQLDISAQKVHEIFISDTKLNISPYYTRPGGAFGGSCLPKDVRALQFIAGDVGAHTLLVDSLIRSNDAHKHFLFEYVTRGVPTGAKVLMIGLAFKADSDDLRESPNIDLARKLLHAGYKVSVLDPALEPSKLIGQNLGYAYSNLPTLGTILVHAEEAEATHYDLVVDCNGRANRFKLDAGQIISTNSLP